MKIYVKINNWHFLNQQVVVIVFQFISSSVSGKINTFLDQQVVVWVFLIQIRLFNLFICCQEINGWKDWNWNCSKIILNFMKTYGKINTWHFWINKSLPLSFSILFQCLRSFGFGGCLFTLVKLAYSPVIGGGSTMVLGPKKEGPSPEVVMGVLRSPGWGSEGISSWSTEQVVAGTGLPLVCPAPL